MNQREEIIERLQALKLDGGSHEMLSAICRAVAPGAQFGWTQGACDGLRLRLISFLSETDEEALREAYTKGCNDGFDCGFASADDWLGQHEDAMAEHGWYQALDADKEVIHADDELFWNEGGDSAGRVTAIGVGQRTGWVWTMEDGRNVSIGHKASKLRHHHAPTVEDVLTEFADEVRRCCDSEQTIAEYAKRLTLAGDAE